MHFRPEEYKKKVIDYVKKYASEEALRQQEASAVSSSSESSMSDFSEDEAGVQFLTHSCISLLIDHQCYFLFAGHGVVTVGAASLSSRGGGHALPLLTLLSKAGSSVQWVAETSCASFFCFFLPTGWNSKSKKRKRKSDNARTLQVVP